MLQNIYQVQGKPCKDDPHDTWEKDIDKIPKPQPKEKDK